MRADRRRHPVYETLEDGRFFCAPAMELNMMLDIGAGTGIWDM